MGKKDNRAQELEVINTAFFLEGTLVELRKDKAKLDESKPTSPRRPTKPILSIPDYDPKSIPEAKEESYPKIKNSDLNLPATWQILDKTSSIAFIVAGIAAIASVGLFFSLYFGTPWPRAVGAIAIAIISFGIFYFTSSKADDIKKPIEEKYRNSTTYKEVCRKIDAENEGRRATVKAKRNEKKREIEEEARRRFARDTEEYEQKLLPTFEQKLAYYNEEALPEYQAEQTALQEAIDAAEAALQEVYDRNILPGKYRNLAAVTFLAAFMGTSQYDLKFSIERYDKDIDHLLAKKNGRIQEAQAAILSQILQESQYSNYLNEQTQDILADSNDVLRETRNWTAANTAMHAYDILQRKKRERKAKKRR